MGLVLFKIWKLIYLKCTINVKIMCQFPNWVEDSTARNRDLKNCVPLEINLVLCQLELNSKGISPT